MLEIFPHLFPRACSEDDASRRESKIESLFSPVLPSELSIVENVSLAVWSQLVLDREI